MNDNDLILISNRKTTLIKGIAIFCVVICHLGNFFTRFTTPLGGIGVALFLIVSGYGLSESYKKSGIKGFWLKRFIGVMIPYFFVEIFYYLFNRDVSLIEIIKDLTFLEPKFRLGWYLNYLLVWYIIFWMFYKLCTRYRLKLNSTLIVSFWFSVSVIIGFHYVDISSIRYEQTFSFFIGVIMSYFPDKIYRFISNKKWLIWILLGILFLGIKQIHYVRELPAVMYVNIDLIIKTAISFGIMGYIVLTDFVYTERSISLLGKYSYELYLVHGSLLLMFNYIDFGVYSVMLFIIATVICSIILKFFVENFAHIIGNKYN